MGKMTLMTALTLNAAGFSDGVNDAIKETKEFNLAIAGASKETIKAFKDISSMGIGEMKKNLMELKKISFAGKTKEEIGVINQRIGDLTDTMGDLRSQQKAMGQELGTSMAGGLQTISAVAEGLVGVASLFGASKEQAEKYQQVMVSLIGVTQAMGVVQNAMETNQFQNIALKIKETAVTIAQSIATKVSTAVQWLYNAALGTTIAIIAGAVIAVAALAAGMYYLYGWLTKTNEAEKNQVERLKAVAEQTKLTNDELKSSYADSRNEYTKQETAIDKLVRKAKDEHISLGERKKALNELIALDPTYLKGITLENIAYDEGIQKIINYKKALYELADAKAVENTYIKIKSQYIENQIAIQQKQSDIQKGIQDREAIATGKAVGSYADLTEQVGYYNSATGRESGTGKLNEDLKDLTNTQYAAALSLGNLTNMMNNVTAPTVNFNTGGTKGSVTSTKSAKDNTDADGAKYEAYINRKLQLNEQEAKEQEALAKEIEDYQVESENAILGAMQSRIQQGLQDSLAYVSQLNEVQNTFVNRNKSQYDKDAENYKSLLDKKLITEEQYAEAIKEIEKQKNKANLQVIGNTFGSIAGLFKENTIAYKAMASAQALINAFLAASAAYASAAAIPVIGFVLGPIAYGAALASGLMAVASINGVQFANGGIVGGTSYTGDLIPARVNSGEMILNKSQQSNLFAMANGVGSSGSGGEVTFKIQGTQLVGVLSNYNKKVNNTR